MTDSKVQEKTREIDKLTGKYLIKRWKKTYLALLDPEHDGSILFSGTAVWWSPALEKNMPVIRTGLTKQQQVELEEALNFKPGSLSPYNREFWGANFKTLNIQVPKEGAILDLDNSDLHKLQYLYCKADPRVAMSIEEAEKQGEIDVEMVITSVDAEAKQESKKLKTKMEAMAKLSNMSVGEQIDFLKVYAEGKNKVSANSKPEFILSAIGKIAENKPQEFLETLNNPYFKTAVFLQDCINAGYVKKIGTVYQTTGGDTIGQSYLSTLDNLNSPEYNEVLLSLKSKLQVK